MNEPAAQQPAVRHVHLKPDRDPGDWVVSRDCVAFLDTVRSSLQASPDLLTVRSASIPETWFHQGHGNELEPAAGLPPPLSAACSRLPMTVCRLSAKIVGQTFLSAVVPSKSRADKNVYPTDFHNIRGEPVFRVG